MFISQLVYLLVIPIVRTVCNLPIGVSQRLEEHFYRRGNEQKILEICVLFLVVFRRAANQHLLSLSSKVMLYFSDLQASAQPAASVLYLEFLRRK